MRYSDEACNASWHGKAHLRAPGCVDAFSHFSRLLSRNKALLDSLHRARQGADVARPLGDNNTEGRGALSEENGLGAKVYVLPVPDALTTHLIRCYRMRRGADPWDDTKPHGNCDGKRSCRDCNHVRRRHSNSPPSPPTDVCSLQLPLCIALQ